MEIEILAANFLSSSWIIFSTLSVEAISCPMNGFLPNAVKVMDVSTIR